MVPGIAGVYIVSALCGVSLSCFMAIASYLLSISVKKDAVARASGIFSIVGGVGGLIAPVFMGKIASAVWHENTPENQFTIAFWGMLIIGVIAFLGVIRKKKKFLEA